MLLFWIDWLILRGHSSGGTQSDPNRTNPFLQKHPRMHRFSQDSELRGPFCKNLKLQLAKHSLPQCLNSSSDRHLCACFSDGSLSGDE